MPQEQFQDEPRLVTGIGSEQKGQRLYMYQIFKSTEANKHAEEDEDWVGGELGSRGLSNEAYTGCHNSISPAGLLP